MNDKIFRLTAIATALAASVTIAMAKPADPRPRVFTQPDGSTVTVQLRGDERSHFYLSEDGYLLSRQGDEFTYGKLLDDGRIASTGIIARDAAQRTSAERAFIATVDRKLVSEVLGLRSEKALTTRSKAPSLYTDETKRYGLCPGSSFPVMGSPKVLVILVEYKDVKFKLEDPAAYFSGMLNQDGFSEYGGTGSVLEYFTENSLGQFTPQFDLYGPVTLPNNRKYYGENDWNGDDMRAAEMVVDACEILDDTVDFSQYDTDGDGFVDNVYIYYAGKGEASYGSSDTVWPHAWTLEEAGIRNVKHDGVKINRYGCSNEWEDGRPDGAGTFVHEFSHVMGLPDLYATNSSSAFTPGYWSALDYGPYNNDGCTPPNYSVFERYALGWMDPQVIDGPVMVSLNQISSNEGCIIPTTKETEFFLLENRQQTGWDTYLPGHGMLIWHIDYKATAWRNNSVNNNSSHQNVDLEEADNTRTDRTRSGDSFPGAKNVTSFTDDTTPSMKMWSGARLNLPITDIEEVDGFITFKVAGGTTMSLDAVVGAEVRVNAGVITACGTPGDTVDVYDATGRQIAHGVVDASGSCTLRTGAKGLAVVRVGDKSRKIIVNGR